MFDAIDQNTTSDGESPLMEEYYEEYTFPKKPSHGVHNSPWHGHTIVALALIATVFCFIGFCCSTLKRKMRLRRQREALAVLQRRAETYNKAPDESPRVELYEDESPTSTRGPSDVEL